MSHIECQSSFAESLARLLLVWCDYTASQSHIRFVAQHALSIDKRRGMITEQLVIGCDTDVGTAVPDQVAAVVTNTLDLAKDTHIPVFSDQNRYLTLLIGAIAVYRLTLTT
jgi:hypothetical protein